jgi:hypothetical protein
MEVLIHLIVWIIERFRKSQKTASAPRNLHSQLPRRRGAQTAQSAMDLKTAEIWRAYRKKQEALEAQFRARAPK